MPTEREALEADGFLDIDLIFERLGIDPDAPAGTAKFALDYMNGYSIYEVAKELGLENPCEHPKGYKCITCGEPLP